MNRIFHRQMSRRKFLMRATQLGLAVGAAGLGVGAILERIPRSPWDTKVFPTPGRATVAVLKATTYNGDLETTIMEGLRLIGADVAGASVLLKPNMVEFDPSSVINTDPRLVAATVAVMKRMGARSVMVGEGPGHRRDTQYIVAKSGLRDLLRDVNASFVDLNIAALTRVPNHSNWTQLGELWLPSDVVNADIVVSMPKMKTHHWAGATLSLKNMFGTMPSRIYGWPKNVLHFAGLHDSILDVASTVHPDIAIVDGIVGMEGDGPIEGTPIMAGHLVFGRDPVAVDSTAARLMGLDPSRIDYVADAGRFLGQARPELITQLGEDPERSATPFKLRPEFEGLRSGSSVASPPANAAGG